MRKYFNFVFVLILLFMFTNVKAYSTNEALNAINNAEKSTNSFSIKLNSWVNSNKSAVIYLTSEEVSSKITSNNEANINYFINKLKSGGYTSASNSLNSIKNSLVTDLNNIKNNRNIVYKYLKDNEEFGVSGNLEVMHRLKAFFKNIDNTTGELLNSIYNIYYNDINNKIDSNSSLEDIIEIINKDIKFSTKLFETFNSDISKWQDLYNSYIDSNYETKITNSNLYIKYTNKLNDGYNTLYKKAYNNFKNRLDKKINTIDNEKGITVKNHNNKLYEIIDELTEDKSKLNTSFNDINKYIKIILIKNNLTKKQSEILKQFDNEIKYVKTHLWEEKNENLNLIEIKNDSDKKYFDIDLIKKIILYKSEILSSNNFIAKLSTDYTKLESSNLYNNNVGTNSIIKVINGNNVLSEFIVAVIADVHPDGKISALDYVAIKNHIMESKKIINQISLLAADCNIDGKISALDYVYIKNYIMSK